MILTETDALLTLIHNVDKRKLDDAVILTWHELIGELDFADCVEAMKAHFRECTDYLLPAHIVAGVRAIRNARSSADPEGGNPLALPSRFEADEIRDERVRHNVRELMAKWGTTPNPEGDPHAAAVERARREKRAAGRPAQLPRPRREPGKPVDLDKVTTGPDWANAEQRERESVLALHRAGHPCGKRACTREACRPAMADADT